MPPKPPPRMSILLVVIVQNLPRFVSGSCRVLSEADGLWSFEYPCDAASLPKVSATSGRRHYTQRSHRSSFGPISTCLRKVGLLPDSSRGIGCQVPNERPR